MAPSVASAIPAFAEHGRAVGINERALFFVKRGRTGTLVPHLRGNGIPKLDARGGVEGKRCQRGPRPRAGAVGRLGKRVSDPSRSHGVA
jgi:hypothetical protein